jgi:hypothetical protein
MSDARDATRTAAHKRTSARHPSVAGLAEHQDNSVLDRSIAELDATGSDTDGGEFDALEDRHAALLAGGHLGDPASQARRIRLLQGLQHGYGNGHVARVLARVQRSVGECPAPPEEKPKVEPEDDAEFQKVENKAGKVAIAEKKHPSARSRAVEAHGAALPPVNDAASQAKAAQVDTMSAQKPGSFDKQAFIAAVRKAIEAASPKNLDEADNYQESGRAAEVKGQVSGLVTHGKQDSQQAIKDATDATPDTSKAIPKSVTPMGAEKPGKTPGSLRAGSAMPRPKEDSEINLANGPCQVNSQMQEADVDEEQLKESNEPDFQGAVDARKVAEEHSEKAPGEFRDKERETLDSQKAEAAASADLALGHMHSTRSAVTGRVGADRTGAKSKDEAAQARVAKDIEDIYNRAKADVTRILADLDPLVDKAFNDGEAQARNEFINGVNDKTRAYKKKRYSGKWGWTRWIRDRFKTNPELNRIVDECRASYIARMDGVINAVAEIIARELTKAKARIEQGRQEVKDHVAQLPKDLQQVGADAQEEIQAQFDQLEGDVNDKQGELVQSLAQKYTAARDAVDEEANKMKEANKGLVDKAIDAVKGVIDTILKLKDMLFNVLAKVASLIADIIKHPIRFLGNLVDAFKTGLNQFTSNIEKHLEKGLMGWLLGTLGDTGIQLPEELDLKGIVVLVLQMLGLDYASIRGIAVKIAGEKVVKALEGTADVMVTLAREGPAGLWKWLQPRIEEINIWDMVVGALKDFVITRIVVAGITWLMSLLNPAAAFIKACKMIYDIVMFFVEHGEQIMDFVNSVLDGMAEIVAGNIASAANLVESSLAKILPLAISFLAAILGIDGIAEKIKEIIGRIRAPITRLVTAVLKPVLKPVKKLYDKGATFVTSMVDKGKALGGKAIAKARSVAKKSLSKIAGVGKPDDRTSDQRASDRDRALGEATVLLQQEEISAADVRNRLPILKARYRLTELRLVTDTSDESEESDHIVAAASPAKAGPTVKKRKAVNISELVDELWEEVKYKLAFGRGKKITRLSPDCASQIWTYMSGLIHKSANKAAQDDALRFVLKRISEAAGVGQQLTEELNAKRIYALLQSAARAVKGLYPNGALTFQIHHINRVHGSTTTFLHDRATRIRPQIQAKVEKEASVQLARTKEKLSRRVLVELVRSRVYEQLRAEIFEGVEGKSPELLEEVNMWATSPPLHAEEHRRERAAAKQEKAHASGKKR